uniref:protein-histidine N-methyltransferase n=1 Tax=Hirondellea gigas TaxID=1518452 RepID=A0A2P2ID43_9CRUS
MGKNKKSASKKNGMSKLSYAVRSDITRLVDTLIKRCAKVPGQSSFSAKQECEDFKQIYNIVEQIRELEKGIQLPTYKRDVQMKEFFQWAKANGIQHGPVSAIEYGSEGYGLQCVENIAEDSRVVSVPVAAMITEHSAYNTYIGPLVKRDPLLQEMGNVRLALIVLLEYLNPESKWRPYLRSLPHTFHTPLHSTPSHINMLMHSPVLESVVKQYRNIGRQYAYFYRILHSLPEARDWPLKEYFTYDAYRWAVCCVCTRVNSIPQSPGAGSATHLALVPFWDLVNHTQGKMSTDFNKTEQQLVCYANRAFSAGEQFTMRYGSRGNADLFLHSGFVAAGNPHDSVGIRLGISKSDGQHAAKLSALSLLGLEPVGEFALLPDDTPLSPQMWAFAVIFCAQPEFVQKVLESTNPVGMVQSVEKEPSHKELCTSVLKFLHIRIGLLMRAYDSRDKSLKDSSDPVTALVSRMLDSEEVLLLNARQYLDSRLAAHAS